MTNPFEKAFEDANRRHMITIRDLAIAEQRIKGLEAAIRAWKTALNSEDDAAICHAENVMLSFIQP